MDHDELYTLLDGYVISENNSRSIASVVERRPLAILGTHLFFGLQEEQPSIVVKNH